MKSTSPGQTKLIFRLTSKPKVPKSWASGVFVPVHAVQTKQSVLGSQLPSCISADSDIGTMDFTPPAKLVSMLVSEMPTPPHQPNASKIGVPQMLASPPPKSKLPITHSRMAPSKVSHSVAMMGGVKVPVYPIDGNARSGLMENGMLIRNSKLPTPSLQRTTKLSTVQVRRPKVDTKDKPPHRGSEGEGRGRTRLA